MTTAITKAQTVALQTYRELEKRIHQNDLDALFARWEFGRLLLDERKANGGKQLPNGRIAMLSESLGLSQAEIRNRMQFAEQYPTKKEVANALATYESWHEIVRRGLGSRNDRGPDRPRESLQAQELRDHLTQWKNGVAGMLAHAKDQGLGGLWPMFDNAELSPEARRFFARWIRDIGDRYVEFGEYLRTSAQEKEQESE